MLVKKAMRLFQDYEKEMASISPDLKEQVQAEKKQAVNQKYAKQIGQAKTQLEQEVDKLQVELSKVQDPKFQLVNQALHYENLYDGNKIPDTIKAVIAALPGMDEELIGIVAEQAKHPCLLLGIYAQSGRIEDLTKAAALRQRVLSKVQIPPEPVKKLAAAERQCLDALYVGADVCTTKGQNRAQKLDYAHKMAALDKILAD